jgi:competence protein ComEC
VEVLNPSGGATMNQENPGSQANNRSIVLKITYKNHRFLLTSDIEKEAEDRLVQSGKDLRSHVLKVPHHGSRTSSTPKFLEEVRPSHAIFTVGLRNIFNLPNSKVLDRYRELGCRILRTDQNGSITFETDGEDLRVTTFLSQSAHYTQNTSPY